jgi:hypothetical protein
VEGYSDCYFTTLDMCEEEVPGNRIKNEIYSYLNRNRIVQEFVIFGDDLPTRLPGGVKLDFSTKKFEFPFST